MTEEEELHNDIHDAFGKIPSDIQEALILWYNVVDPSDDDIELLTELYNTGGFEHGFCEQCGDEWWHATPRDWGQFQGVDDCDVGMYNASICTTCFEDAKTIVEKAGGKIVF